MEKKVLKLKDMRRKNISYTGSKEGGIESTIIRNFLVKPKESNYEIHEIESAKRFIGHTDLVGFLDQVIITLEKKEPDWYIVRVLTNPLISPIEIYNTKTYLVADVHPTLRRRYANQAYEGVRDILRKGNYKVHRFLNDVVGFEELDK
jgi:hypothetical protein